MNFPEAFRTITSPMSRPSEVDRAHAAGADVVLIKPVTPESLLREIDRLLEQPAPAAESLATKATRSAAPRILKKSYERVTTTTPPRQPPDLWCPSCDRPLQYQCSFIGGVSQRQPEQWDEYECAANCGLFEYRHRTRKLRRGP